MNSLHAVSASKNNNTERTAHPVSTQRVKVHAMVKRDANDCNVQCVLLFVDALTTISF